MDLPERFEWDEGNREKNWKKHRVSIIEIEQVFESIPLAIFKDGKHSEREERFIALGQTYNGRYLHVTCTIRHNAVRVISARPQNRKERSFYEKTKN